jgi:hypothetical protein
VNWRDRGASRLQPEGASRVLFEGAPGGADAPATPAYANEFFATTDGLALAKALMRIDDMKLRRLLVQLIEDCAEL